MSDVGISGSNATGVALQKDRNCGRRLCREHAAAQITTWPVFVTTLMVRLTEIFETVTGGHDGLGRATSRPTRSRSEAIGGS